MKVLKISDDIASFCSGNLLYFQGPFCRHKTSCKRPQAPAAGWNKQQETSSKQQQQQQRQEKI